MQRTTFMISSMIVAFILKTIDELSPLAFYGLTTWGRVYVHQALEVLLLQRIPTNLPSTQHAIENSSLKSICIFQESRLISSPSSWIDGMAFGTTLYWSWSNSKNESPCRNYIVVHWPSQLSQCYGRRCSLSFQNSMHWSLRKALSHNLVTIPGPRFVIASTALFSCWLIVIVKFFCIFLV